jgi:hypothetical protein
MARKTKDVETSNSGLISADVATLTPLREQLEKIFEHRMLLGGNEAERCERLLKRVTNRLEPEDPIELARVAGEFADQFGPQIKAARSSFRSVIDEGTALYREHYEEQERRRAALAVDEVLG